MKIKQSETVTVCHIQENCFVPQVTITWEPPVQRLSIHLLAHSIARLVYLQASALNFNSEIFKLVGDRKSCFPRNVVQNKSPGKPILTEQEA